VFVAVCALLGYAHLVCSHARGQPIKSYHRAEHIILRQAYEPRGRDGLIVDMDELGPQLPADASLVSVAGDLKNCRGWEG
jgi:hypothetical protein